MASPFDSAWLKWGRAVVHAHALETHILETASKIDPEKDLTFGVTHYNAQRHGFGIELVAMKPLPTVWGLMLGDIATNYKAALDHLAWAVVGRGKLANKLTERQAKGIYFPVASTRDQFKRLLNGGRLRGTRQADITIIRRYQPYHAGKRREPFHPLSVLNKLCNDDKHREIRPVLMLPIGTGYNISYTNDCVPHARFQWKRQRLAPMEIGAEVDFVRVRKTGPNPQVQVERSEITLQPCVNDRVQIADWLDRTRESISLLLMDFAPAPGELVELGDPAFFFPPGP